jgi:hypothetical protein
VDLKEKAEGGRQKAACGVGKRRLDQQCNPIPDYLIAVLLNEG